jgi:hypothetical protein
MKRGRLRGRISKVAGNATAGSGGAGQDEDYEAQYRPLKAGSNFRPRHATTYLVG